jgi:hypothetical protein
MHNLSATIDVLRDCETVIRSRLITDREERLLLDQLVTQLPTDLLPDYAKLIINAIERYNARPRKGPYDAEKAARPPEGKQDAAQVAPGHGSPAAEAPKGPTEGKPEQAQNAGSVARSGNDGPTAAQAPAKAQGPKQGKARK